MSLQGMIEEMGLGEVIQALSLNRHKGTLRIETDEGISKFFYLSEGEIVLIRTVKSEPVRIGELLVRAGKIDGPKLDQGLELQKRTGQRLGDALVALGHVNPGDIDAVIRQKFEEEFLDIFLLDRGRFEFIFGLSPESLFSPDERLERIALNTSSLMLEAMRRVDDCQSIRKELGSLDEIYRNRTSTLGPRIEDYRFEGLVMPPEARREVYEAVDGSRTIREVLAAAQAKGASRGTAFAFLHILKQNDLIRPLDAQMCLTAAKEALDRGDAAATAKFVRAVMSKEKADVALVRRYMDFVKKSARPAFALRESKYLAAQYLASGEIDTAIALYQEARALDAHDSEVLDRLFYAHLRKSDVASALDVGFEFKDYMQRDTDLPVVARVVKNLKELAPEDPRVLELSGLLLRRQDRIDDARAELQRALEALGRARGTEARRAAVLGALAEIDPEKSELAKERDALLKEALVAQAQARARKRLGGAILCFVTFVIAWLAVGEIVARREISEADTLSESDDTAQRLQALQLYQAAATRLTTVRGQAREHAALLQKKLEDELQRSSGKTEAALEQARAAREAREAAARKKAVDDALVEIADARAKRDWERTAQLVLALLDAHPDDPRTKELKLPLRVKTTPPNARVTVEGAEARSPCVLDATPRKRVQVAIAKPGFTPLETSVEVDALKELDLPLVPGHLWKRDLEKPLAGALAASGRGRALVLAVLRNGSAVALKADDGSTIFVRKPPEDSADSLDEPAPPAIVQDVGLVSGRSGLLLGIDLATGEERWRSKVGGPILHAPLAVEVDGKERALVARGTRLELVDAQSGTVDRSYDLPAAAGAAPAARGAIAAVALVDGRIAAVDLASGKLAWTATAQVDPVGPPLISPELGFVLVASREGTLLALALADGSQAYRRSLDLGPLDGGVALEEGKLYLGTTSSRVAAVDATDGRVLWYQVMDAALAAAPRSFGGGIYAPLKTGDLIELAPSDGKTRRTIATNAPPSGAPVLAGGRLLLGAGTAILAFERPERD